MPLRFPPLAILLIGLFASFDSARAEPLDMFTKTCGQFTGQTEQLRRYLAQHYDPAPMEKEVVLLQGKGGKVWQSSNSDAIVSYDDGRCAVTTAALFKDIPSFQQSIHELSDLVARLVKSGKAIAKEAEVRPGPDKDQETVTWIYVITEKNAPTGIQYKRVANITPGGSLAIVTIESVDADSPVGKLIPH